MFRRSNPWIGGGSNGDAPTSRSPDQTMRSLRRWPVTDETGKEEEEEEEEEVTTNATISPTTKTLRNSVVKLLVDEESNVFFSLPVVHSGDDSLLTTSMETDSLCFQSEISDNETISSRTSSQLDCHPAPNDNDRRPDDEVTLPTANSPVENAASHPRTGLSSLCVGRYEDTTATDGQGNGPSIEAVDPDEKNRKRLRKSPESTSDCKKRPPFSVEEAGQISELLPCCETQTTTERRRSDEVRTKTTTNPDNVHHNNNDETLGKPRCHQRRRRRRLLETESDGTAFMKQYDEDPITASSDQLSRKILTVRSSLQDKVALLKHEKKVVDRKIREAKEEERLRLRQLELFRQQLSQTRKEILLRTLEELKKQLSQQVLRLQNVYDFVLVEQRHLVCCY